MKNNTLSSHYNVTWLKANRDSYIIVQTSDKVYHGIYYYDYFDIHNKLLYVRDCVEEAPEEPTELEFKQQVIINPIRFLCFDTFEEAKKAVKYYSIYN